MTTADRARPTTIFISYRRDDSKPFALLLKYEIEKHLQFVRVFLDTTDIHPGDEFPEAIRRSISEADVVLALIGDSWMPRRGQGRRDGDDGVEEELRLALEGGLRRLRGGPAGSCSRERPAIDGAHLRSKGLR